MNVNHRDTIDKLQREWDMNIYEKNKSISTREQTTNGKRESTLDFFLTTGKTNKASRIENRGGSNHYHIMTTYEIQKPNKGTIDNII